MWGDGSPHMAASYSLKKVVASGTIIVAGAEDSTC